jgi:DNA-binding NarL/FixJ family response regulator
MGELRILLVEDHTLVRAGLRALLQRVEGFEIVGEAGDGHEALEMIGAHRPDIVLMDIGVPGLNGLEISARVARHYPHVRVIILSMHAGEEYIRQAVRSGAAGYLLKDAGVAELEIAIRAVERGDRYLSPAVSRQLVDDYLDRLNDEDTRERLTPRQREVLQLIAEGYTTQQIALKLNIAVKTVETHRTQLMERLGIHDVAGLVRYAVRAGIVSPIE